MNKRASEAAALVARAIRFLDAGKPDKALRALDDAVRIDPDDAVVHCHRGNALADLGRQIDAMASYDRAIALDPGFADPHDFCGVLLAQAGRPGDAMRSIDRALALAPGHINALNNRATLLRDMGQLEAALEDFDTIIRLAPNIAAAHNGRAHILAAMDLHAEALMGFDRAVRLDPALIEAYCNRATALAALGDVEAAVAGYRHVLSLDPNHVWAWFNLGEVLAKADRHDEAEDSYRKLLVLQPDLADAYASLGMVLTAQRRLGEGAAMLQKAVALDLTHSKALLGLGIALEGLGREADALTCYDHLISIAPGDALAHQKRGLVLMIMADYPAAIDSLDRATDLDPATRQAVMRLHAAMHLCRWTGFAAQLADLRTAIMTGREDVMPFPLLALCDDPALQLASARVLGSHHPVATSVPLTQRYPDHERIRIGYFSADFSHHATMQLLAETLEAHDRHRFELVAFSFGQAPPDDWHTRARATFDTFVETRFMSDKQIAHLAREMEIDIAIDLKGYTRECRFGIFAERAAPVQASYLGYPGTCGVPAIDYLIADRMLIPEDARPFYTERIVYLPGSYQANPALRPISGGASRQDAGLPAEAMVFCCFNQSYKITPDMFDVWLRILANVEGSVLWLWVDNPVARHNLQREAAARGMAPERIVFAARAPTEQHLDRLRLADLFLDTLPCNAHTTASDALRAGLPIITCAGRSLAARVGASLLEAVVFPELIATDLASYEALAVKLGNDRDRLAAIRAMLGRNLITSSLFDPRSMARRLEAAYAAMHERHRRGAAPDDIFIEV